MDLSRVSENLVGVRRRQYGVYRRVGPPPDYPTEVEYISLGDL
jgi:hypothetical protein